MATNQERAGLSGAASGAGAGASFGPWGALIGGVVGGGLAYAGAEGSGQQAPGQLPGPSAPGPYSTDNMGWERDPITGAMRQVSYGFDPSAQGNQLDADMMWNSFMGRGNEGIVNQIDWKMKGAQQEIDRLKAQMGKSQVNFKDIASPAIRDFINPDGTPMSREQIMQRPDVIAEAHRWAKDQGKGFFQQNANLSMLGKGVGEQVVGTGLDKNVSDWLEGTLKKNGWDESVKKYEDAKRTVDQNNLVIQKKVDDLQNQYDYYGEAKTQAASGVDMSNNPLMRGLTDTGAKWEPKDNTNPFADEMGRQTQRRLDQDAAGGSAETGDMRDLYRRMMEQQKKNQGLTDTANSQPDEWEMMLKRSVGDYNPQMIQAQEFDPNAANSMLASMNAGTDSAQAQALRRRDAVNASRGMTGMGASNELSDASMGLENWNQKMGNQMQAAQYGNTQRDRQFQQEATAAGSNNQANYQKSALGVSAAGQGSSMYQNRMNQQNQRGSQDIDNIMKAFGGYQSGNAQDYGQMMGSLNASNAMRAEDRGRDIQDYQIGRDENNTLNQRAGDMWNRLQGLKQQGVSNNQNQQQINNGASAQGAAQQMEMANRQDQSTLANIQMQNQWQMFNQQQQAQQQQAMMQGIGALGQGVASYYGGQKPNTGQPANTATSEGYTPPQQWTATDPNKPPPMPNYYNGGVK